MRFTFYSLFLIIFAQGPFYGQILGFKENGKWGVKENGLVVVKPQYDTLVVNDSTGGTCLACYKTMGASANKFIKVYTKTYLCNYLNTTGQRLSVKTEGNDSCSVFTLTKNTVRQFTENRNYFVVGVKNKKHLVDRHFKQLTFKGYYDLGFCANPGFLVARTSSDGAIVYTGLILFNEEQLIPYQYSDIKVNPADSLIIACSGAVRQGAEDDVFNYEGKKTGAYRRHIEMATKNFVIHKLYEPKEYYIIYNPQNKEEKNLNAEEVKLYSSDELLIRIKNDWYIYNMVKGEKRPVKQT